MVNKIICKHKMEATIVYIAIYAIQPIIKQNSILYIIKTKPQITVKPIILDAVNFGNSIY